MEILAVDDDDEINKDECECDTYSSDSIKKIKKVYVYFAIAWILLIFWLGAVKPDILVILFISMPIVLALIAYSNIQNIKTTCEKTVLKTNYITVLIVGAAIISQWNPQGKKNINKTQFYKLLTAAFIILLISLQDLWISEEYRTVIIHVKVALQSMSTVLLIIAVYSLFREISGTQHH